MYEKEIEIWKDISGYEGIYQISNRGRVRSLDRLISCKNNVGEGSHKRFYPGKILENTLTAHGYYQVNLSVSSKNRKFFVHRLVAQGFIPNPNNLPEVNHKDLDKANANVSNLEWVSHHENMIHAQNNNVALHSGGDHPNSKSVVKLSIKGEFIEIFETVSAAAKSINAGCSSISKCCYGRPNKSGFVKHTRGGYRWMFYDDWINRPCH